MLLHRQRKVVGVIILVSKSSSNWEHYHDSIFLVSTKYLTDRRLCQNLIKNTSIQFHFPFIVGTEKCYNKLNYGVFSHLAINVILFVTNTDYNKHLYM